MFNYKLADSWIIISTISQRMSVNSSRDNLAISIFKSRLERLDSYKENPFQHILKGALCELSWQSIKIDTD